MFTAKLRTHPLPRGGTDSLPRSSKLFKSVTSKAQNSTERRSIRFCHSVRNKFRHLAVTTPQKGPHFHRERKLICFPDHSECASGISSITPRLENDDHIRN